MADCVWGWFVGIDWATEEHAVCLVDRDGLVRGERVFAHSGTGLAEMCTWLMTLTEAAPEELAVAIEVPHGAVVETLLERGMAVHAINPKQLDRFRDRFTVAGAKDDRRDARVLADSLRTDGACFRRLRVDEAPVIELREWSRLAEDLQQQRGRLANRVRQQLLRYYPQMLALADDVASDAFLTLWERIPTPAVAARVRQRSIDTLLRQTRVRRLTAVQVLATLREPPLTVAPGTVEAATAHIACLATQLRLLNRQLKEARRMLERLTQAIAERHPAGEALDDVQILRSAPGIGTTVLATLLAEGAQPLAARDYAALRTLGGVAPVTKNSGKRSGKRSFVVMRNACSLRLREALYHWARVASQHDPKSRRAYAELRGRGQTHGRALRTVADRLLRMLCAMLRTRTAFDPNKRLVNPGVALPS
jgi:transposase